MRKWIISLALIMFLIPLPVWAAKCLVGEYIIYDEIVIKTIVKDKDTIRIDIGTGDDDGFGMYFLAVMGKRWMAGHDDGGEWEIIDFDLLTETDGFGSHNELRDFSANAKIAQPVNASVNGFKGRSFAVEYFYDNDYVDEFTFVLSENADVVAVTRALNVFARDIYYDDVLIPVKLIGRIAKERGKEQGLLQYNDLQLKSITKASFNDDYFTLPKDGVLIDVTEFLEN